jgi:phytoene dehydrogenase-like protein
MIQELSAYDSVVIGSGPNGLAAAITLSERDLKIAILEASRKAGGGIGSAELTLPGFIHDTGAAIFPMAVASPFFGRLPLTQHGLRWVYPPAALAHPFDDGSAVLLTRSLKETADTLGPDGDAYTKLVKPMLDNPDTLFKFLLGTMRQPPGIGMAWFAVNALRSARDLAGGRFRSDRAMGFMAGLAAHSVLPLDSVPSAAFALVMCLSAHAYGWPIPAGGAGLIALALAGYFKSLGGHIFTGSEITGLDELTGARAVFFDTSPQKMAGICGSKLPAGYREAVGKYRYGPGIFKVDWALDGPIPWRQPQCSLAGTVHLGGGFPEIAEAEDAAWNGRVTSRPFVILAQPSLFDPSRAPAGKHTAWAYCHIPGGCAFNMTDYIESQVERFAPGFKDLILAKHAEGPSALESANPNLVGGDITGGAQTLRQLLCRPVCRPVPYATPLENIFICSASTPPGAGVHGMCGFHAAQIYLRSRRL